MEIYVGSLPYTVTEEDLKEAFAPFGEVSSVRLVSDKLSGKSKGFGFVEMASSDEATKAKEGLNEIEYEGRTMKVDDL